MDLTGLNWRKSSRSGSSGTECVEIAFATDATAVRDSKNPGGTVLTFPSTGWSTFLHTVRADHR